MVTVLAFFGILVGFSIYAFSNPAASYFLYQLVYFLNPSDRWWGNLIPSFGYSFYTAILMLALYFFSYNKLNKNVFLKVPPSKWNILVVLSYILASFYAYDTQGHIEASFNFFKTLIIVFLAFKLVNNVKNLNLALLTNIGGSAYIGLLAFQIGRNSGDRIEGIGTTDAPDANGIAAAMAPSLLLASYYLWIKTTRNVKIFVAIAAVFIANGLVLINSRGAFLATALGSLYFFCFLLFSKMQRPRQRQSAIAFAFLALLAGAYLADETFFARMETILEEKEVDYSQESGSTRIEFWKAAVRFSMDHPFGKGFRAFDIAAPYYLPEDLNTGASRNRSVHSTWFETLTEIGYHGLIFVLILIISTFRMTSKTRKHLSKAQDYDAYFKVVALEAGLLTIIIAMSFLNRLRAELFYWSLLYCYCAYNIYYLQAVNTDSRKDAERISPDGTS